MPIDNLPTFQKGKRILAGAINALVAAIRANRVIADASSGLVPRQTPDGLHLSLIQRPDIYFAVVTTQVTASSGSTLGQGLGTIYVLTVASPGGTATISATGLTGAVIYNGGSSAIAVGKRMIVQLIQGQWVSTVEFC